MTDWRDRIVEVKRMRVRDILAHERNPRLHPAGQKDAVRGLLNEVGKADVLRAYTGADGKIKLWDGHLRQGLDPDQEWWVAITDLTEAEAAKMLVLFDPIAALAEQDTEKLESLLRDVNTGEAALQQMLADMTEDAGIVPPNNEAGKDTEPEIDKAEELRKKWQVEPGQLWQLGDHRLICGDCTDKATVERVMGGERADMVFTDPPYGVEFQGKGGDSIEGDISYALIPLLFADLSGIVADKCWIYICGGSSNFSLYARMFDRYFRNWPRLIVWDKGNMTMRHNGYHSNYEFIYYSFTKGSGDRWYSSRAGEPATDLWRVQKPSNDRLHLTEKPVELPARAIANSCPPSGIVWEPFSGSGSTLIACENLGRRARACEISPGYVAVALERWSTHTNKTPVLVDV